MIYISFFAFSIQKNIHKNQKKIENQEKQKNPEKTKPKKNVKKTKFEKI
jgi:cell division protein FtsL